MISRKDQHTEKLEGNNFNNQIEDSKINLIKELKLFENKIDRLKISKQIKLSDIIFTKEFLDIVFRVQISLKFINRHLILKLFAKKLSDNQNYDILYESNFFKLIRQINIRYSNDKKKLVY